MCWVVGYLIAKLATTAFVLGLRMVFETIRIAPPLAAISDNFETTSLSRLSQAISESPFLGPFNFSMSYNPNNEAWTRALTPPPLTLEDLFPSILTGRPSRVFTTILAYSPPSEYVEAYQSAIVGKVSTGLFK